MDVMTRLDTLIEAFDEKDLESQGEILSYLEPFRETPELLLTLFSEKECREKEILLKLKSLLKERGASRECRKTDFDRLGLYFEKNEIASCLITPSGKGIGSIGFRKCLIAPFGLHYAPFGDSTRFGVHRSSPPYEDVVHKKGLIQAWTRSIHEENPKLSGNTWVETVCRLTQKKCSLTFQLEMMGSVEKPRIVFFAHADHVVLGQKRYSRGSLERYQGKASRLILEREGEEVVLESLPLKEMEIIPLGGDIYFWGASFLIAYELSDLTELHLSF